MSTNHLDVPTDESCAFCAYIRGERPYTILRRSDKIATLVTREQRGVGHLLVVPIRHVPTILELSDDEAQGVILEVREMAALIDRVFERPGIAVWQNNGVSAAQAIGHVHFHVAGTLSEGGTDFGDVPELTVAETDAIAATLRHAT
jgi:histidine triad (HIT) family protein